MSENGNYVTRAELAATVKPIQSDITEIKADVKTLLTRDAGTSAVRQYKRRESGSRLSWGAILVSAMSLVGWATNGFHHF